MSLQIFLCEVSMHAHLVQGSWRQHEYYVTHGPVLEDVSPSSQGRTHVGPGVCTKQADGDLKVEEMKVSSLLHFPMV